MNDVDTRSGSGVFGVVVGFLGGALVGTVLTLLVAPRSGTETRRRIADTAASSRDALARVGSAAKQATAAALATLTTALHEESAPDGQTGGSRSPRSSASYCAIGSSVGAGTQHLAPRTCVQNSRLR